jgi:hypothetical protein
VAIIARCAENGGGECFSLFLSTLPPKKPYELEAFQAKTLELINNFGQRITTRRTYSAHKILVELAQFCSHVRNCFADAE